MWTWTDVFCSFSLQQVQKTYILRYRQNNLLLSTTCLGGVSCTSAILLISYVKTTMAYPISFSPSSKFLLQRNFGDRRGNGVWCPTVSTLLSVERAQRRSFQIEVVCSNKLILTFSGKLEKVVTMPSLLKQKYSLQSWVDGKQSPRLFSQTVKRFRQKSHLYM